MHRFRSVARFIAIVLCIAVPATAALACMADQSDTAMTQMACCKSAKPDCGTASKGTMECCKTGDRPDQQNVAKAPMLSNPLKAQLMSAAVTVETTGGLLTVRRSYPPVMLFGGTTSPPHLAFSTLLI